MIGAQLTGQDLRAICRDLTETEAAMKLVEQVTRQRGRNYKGRSSEEWSTAYGNIKVFSANSSEAISCCLQ
jgi:hypothetical protein